MQTCKIVRKIKKNNEFNSDSIDSEKKMLRNKAKKIKKFNQGIIHEKTKKKIIKSIYWKNLQAKNFNSYFLIIIFFIIK